MRTVCGFVTLIVVLVVASETFGATVDAQFKETVGFVYVADTNGTPIPYGTGFFVGVKMANATNNAYVVYFVTAKHVFRTPDNSSWLPSVFLRLNKRDGTSEFGRIPLVTEAKGKTVYTHEDDSVDIAVIPALPDQTVYDYKFIPDEFLVTSNEVQQLKIAEGSDIFFTGLFTHYPGRDRNHPIVRFGRVALFTNEKLDWQGQSANLLLVETGAYGGNSGSPVFFYLGADREPNVLGLAPIIKLAGVMKGCYLDNREIKVTDVRKIPFSQSNIGIAAVVPAQLLRDILFGKELTKLRGF